MTASAAVLFAEVVLMARWKLARTREGHLTLDYYRPGALGVFRAGTLQGFTEVALVVEWIVDQEVTAAGDIVVLPDGDVLAVLASPPGVS